MKPVAMPQLPIQSLMNLMENHFAAQSDLQNIRVNILVAVSNPYSYAIKKVVTIFQQKKLQQSSTRMRMLERRFFTKLDNKKSDSIESVLALLKTTHQQITTRIHDLEKTKQFLYRFEYA